MNTKTTISFALSCGLTTTGSCHTGKKSQNTDERASGRSGNMGHGTQASQSVVDEYLREGGEEGDHDRNGGWEAYTSVKDADKSGGKSAERQ